MSEISVSGKALFGLGYTVDQVVHDYGDLCHAITDLAFERDAPFTVDQFRTLNRCLDNAIADAVTEFSFQRDMQISVHQIACEKQRLGFLAHELRNALGTATCAFRALDVGNMTVRGATGAALSRSLAALNLLIGGALVEVRGEKPRERQTFSLASFIAESAVAGRFSADSVGRIFEVRDVDPLLAINANRELLHAALANLLQNAFKFTHANTAVTLNAHAFGEFVLIDVEDHCGGLPPKGVENMFVPFKHSGHANAGLGLGLSIARQSIEADLGTLSVRDVPGTGCVFTIRLPRHFLS